MNHILLAFITDTSSFNKHATFEVQQVYATFWMATKIQSSTPDGEFLVVKCGVWSNFGFSLTAKLLWYQLGVSLVQGLSLTKNLPL